VKPQEQALATNCRQVVIRLSWKALLEEIPASKQEYQSVILLFEMLKYREAALLTFEEECRLVGNQVTSKVLGCVDQAGDDCSSAVSTLPQIEKCWFSTHLFFDPNSTLNHGKGPLGILFGLSTESLDGTKSLFLASAADKPPGGFGCEK
jgi:hypothetical protein